MENRGIRIVCFFFLLSITSVNFLLRSFFHFLSVFFVFMEHLYIEIINK